MKKKGFTLIELLAVILVLAIIAIIAVPQILGVIDKAKEGAAKSSALGYIDALEKKVALSILQGETFEDREYSFGEIDVEIKGKAPKEGTFELTNGLIENASFCSNGYIVTYNEGKAETGERCGEDSSSSSEATKLISSLKVSKTTSFLVYPAEDTIEVTENKSNGTLSCTSSDTSVATCSINENNLKIKSGTKEGQTTITLKSSSTEKYREATVAIIVSTEKGALTSISAYDYNGVYDGAYHGITVTSENVINHSNSVTAGTAKGDNSKTLTFGGTFTVPSVTYDAQGHITAKGTTTMTMPANPNTTYTLTQDSTDGHKITLTPSSGTA